MRIYAHGLPAVLAGALLITPASAEDVGVELAFVPHTMTVTLLNEGGKYVAVDLKHIPEGGRCRMDEGATILRIGPGAAPDTTLVRAAAPQISSGGCPFLTTFALSNPDYAAARAAFLAKETDAKQKVENIKKQLGDKWNELMGK
jgi:hypothetical protein